MILISCILPHEAGNNPGTGFSSSFGEMKTVGAVEEDASVTILIAAQEP